MCAYPLPLHYKTSMWNGSGSQICLRFADDAALTAHTEEALQRLISCLAHACREFSLTIRCKKTQILGQDVTSARSISIRDHTFEVVEDFTYLLLLLTRVKSLSGHPRVDDYVCDHFLFSTTWAAALCLRGNFTYLGSTISSSLSLDAKLNKRIGKAATTLAHTLERGSGTTMLTTATKMLYQAHSFTAVNPGHSTPANNRGSTLSNYTASEGFWASPGKTESQTPIFWRSQECQACSQCSAKGGCDGLGMSAV